MSCVVVGIILKKNPLSYFLVSSKKDFWEFTGYYYPPAGHVEPGENEIDALKREIREELGIEVMSAIKLDTNVSDITNQKTSWYICETNNFDFKINYDELSDAGFFTQSEMNSMNIWPATKKVFEEYIIKNATS
jgi:8-oxo-dGTP diphosphatase